MKNRLMDILICPDCKKKLNLDIYKKIIITNNSEIDKSPCQKICSFEDRLIDNDVNIEVCRRCYQVEILQGYLNCKCGNKYPIINGIPRFLPKNLLRCLNDRYPSFFSKYGKDNSTTTPNQDNEMSVGPDSKKKETIDKFGYEWTEFSDYDADNFLKLMQIDDTSFFKNKFGLGAGDGAGRHSREAVKYGAEMVSVDLGWGVESIYKNNNIIKTHVIQADITNLPFREGIFDFIYSLGVLHHTSDTRKSFLSLVPHLKEGGEIFVWIYSNKRRTLLYLFSIYRKFTIRLPNKMIKYLSFLSALIDYGIFIKPYKVLSKNGTRKTFIDFLVPERIKNYSIYDFFVSYTDWFDRLSYPIVNYHSDDEIYSWFQEGGLENVKVTPTGLNASSARGRKPISSHKE